MAKRLVTASSLSAFIADDERRAWPGASDCCMSLANWAMWIGHPDPAAHLRGSYDDEPGFQRIIAAAGGAVPVVKRCVDVIGGVRRDLPQLGLIGVVGSAANTHRQWGAIFDGRHWLVRTRRTFEPISATPLAIWEI